MNDFENFTLDHTVHWCHQRHWRVGQVRQHEHLVWPHDWSSGQWDTLCPWQIVWQPTKAANEVVPCDVKYRSPFHKVSGWPITLRTRSMCSTWSLFIPSCWTWASSHASLILLFSAQTEERERRENTHCKAMKPHTENSSSAVRSELELLFHPRQNC